MFRDMILDACRINQAQRPILLPLLSKVGVSLSMKDVKNELKEKSTISSAALADLERFNFRGTLIFFS